MTGKLRLGVNIDHVATIRNARGGPHPDPLRAARAAAQAGAAPPAGALLGPEPAKPVPAQLPDVLARVNGEAIGKDDFDRALAALEARNGGSVPAQQRDRILRDVLDQIVAYRLLVQESRARKIAVADAEVDARIKEIQAQLPGEPHYNSVLTIIRVLERKGHLVHRVEGKTHFYRAGESKEKARARLLRHLVDHVFSGSAASVVLNLVQVGDLTPKDLDDIRNKIAKMPKEKKDRGHR